MAITCNFRDPRLLTDTAISNLHSLVSSLSSEFTISCKDLAIVFLECVKFTVPTRPMDGNYRQIPWLFVANNPKNFDLFKTDMTNSAVYNAKPKPAPTPKANTPKATTTASSTLLPEEDLHIGIQVAYADEDSLGASMEE